MKNLPNLIILLLFLVQSISCHHNRLKSNEKELTNEIIAREKERDSVNKADREKRLADTLNRHQGGFRLKENRFIDKAHPPLEIDITGSLNNLKEVNLSDVAKGINYIRIEPVPDTTLPVDLKFKYYLMDNYIVAVNLYGIHLYAKDGRYIRSVVKNHFTGVKIMTGSVVFWNDYTMKGGGVSVWSNGND